MQKIPCSVTILTLNNEDTIEHCLRSVSFCDDIVVLDGNSTDNTREIAQRFGARVYDQQDGAKKNAPITSFTDMRVKAFALAKNDWVMYIDSDEYMDDDLQRAITEVVTRNNPKEMGQFRRIAVVENKPIDHAYYYPDWTDRLINKTSGIHWKPGNRVHERLIIPDHVNKVKLDGKLYSRWPGLEACIKKDDYYQSLAVAKLKDQAHEKKMYELVRGAWLNTLRAIKVLVMAIYLPLRHRNVLPFRYHMRFVRYNLKHAWMWEKWRIMTQAVWQRQHRMLKVLLILALIGRLAVAGTLMIMHGQDVFVYSVNGDAVEYANITKNLVERGVFSDQTQPPFAPQSWRTPGLPLMMIPLGAHLGWFVPTVLLNIVLTTALVAMVWHTTRTLFGERAAHIAAALTAVEPNMMFWPSQVLTEPLFMVLFFAVILMLMRWMEHPHMPTFAYAMVLLTIATYVRQVSFFLLIVLPVCALIWAMSHPRVKEAYVSIIAGCACAVILLFPWYYRNYEAYDIWTFDVQFAGKGSIGKYLESYSIEKYGETAVQHFPELLQENGSVNYEALYSFAVKTALNDPLPFLKIGLLSGIPFFATDGYFTIVKTFNPTYEIASFDKTWDGTVLGLKSLAVTYMQTGGVVFLVAKVLYAMLALLAVCGAIFAIKKIRGVQRWQVVLILAVIAYAWAASGLASYARFRYPFSPFIFMLAAYAISVLTSKKRI